MNTVESKTQVKQCPGNRLQADRKGEGQLTHEEGSDQEALIKEHSSALDESSPIQKLEVRTVRSLTLAHLGLTYCHLTLPKGEQRGGRS